MQRHQISLRLTIADGMNRGVAGRTDIILEVLDVVYWPY